MTQSQRAAVAMIYPEPEKLKRGGSSVSKQQGLSKARLSEARTILQYTPDLSDNVLNGSASLDDAYKTARERKDAASSEETQLAALRERYPVLADKVVEEELTLPGATAEADELDARAKVLRSSAYGHAAKIFYIDSAFKTAEHMEQLVAMFDAHPGEFETQERLALKDVIEACEAAPAQLKTLAQLLKKRTAK